MTIEVRRGDLSPGRTRFWDSELWGWQELWLAPQAVVQGVRLRYGIPATSATLLADGMLNQTWRVESDGTPGDRPGDVDGVDGVGTYAVRVGRPERGPAHVAFEHAVLAALAPRVPVVPEPVVGLDGESGQAYDGKLLSVFPYVQGFSGLEVEPDRRAAQAAQALARLHRAGLGLDLGQRPGFVPIDRRPATIWPQVRPILRAKLATTDGFDALVAAADEEHARLENWLADLRASGRELTRGLVHGDFNPRNLIFRDAPAESTEPDGPRPAELAAVIDWDECRDDVLAAEVASVALGGGDQAVGNGDPLGFWRAYRDAGGPVPDAELDLFGGFARIGSMSELQWLVDDGVVNPNAAGILANVLEATRGLAAAATAIGITTP